MKATLNRLKARFASTTPDKSASVEGRQLEPEVCAQLVARNNQISGEPSSQDRGEAKHSSAKNATPASVGGQGAEPVMAAGVEPRKTSTVAPVGATVVKQPVTPRADGRRFEAVAELVEKGVAEQLFPGAVVLLSKNEEIVYWKSFGQRSYEGQSGRSPVLMQAETVFDIGGLTRIVATTTLLMQLVETGKLSLDDRVSRYVHAFGVLGKSSITVGQLLSHCSGLAAATPYFEELIRQNSGARMGIMASKGARDLVVNTINRSSLKFAPGSKQVESDPGFILLGELVELLTGMSLERAFFKMVCRPLRLAATSYIDLSMLRRKGYVPVEDIIAPTEQCNWRRKLLVGEVFDDNAWAMGGIAGHNGLFSTAPDLHKFASGMLRSYRGEGSLVDAATVRKFWRMSETREEEMCFGWDVPRKENGLASCGFSNRAVGSDSATGCSLWIEPKEGLHMIVLTNAVHPNRMDKKFRQFRPELLKACLEALREN